MYEFRNSKILTHFKEIFRRLKLSYLENMSFHQMTIFKTNSKMLIFLLSQNIINFQPKHNIKHKQSTCKQFCAINIVISIVISCDQHEMTSPFLRDKVTITSLLRSSSSHLNPHPKWARLLELNGLRFWHHLHFSWFTNENKIQASLILTNEIKRKTTYLLLQ